VGILRETHGMYPYIMKEVAEQFKIPFIDLTLLSENLVASLGMDNSRELFISVEPGEYELFP
jgi:hypothetical protein